MLSSISWQQYLAAVIILTTSYYGYVFLRYYQSEIANFFNRKNRASDILPFVNAKPLSVMGEAKLADNVTMASSEDLYFGAADPDETEVTAANVTETETAKTAESELIQEADRLIDAFKDIDDKPQFLTLLKILVDSYKRFAAEIDLTAASATIIEISKEKLMFSVTASDLQGI